MTNRPDGIRTKFQIDRRNIVLSKAFRRLKHKTQMIWSPRGDHIRTRSSHAIEVSTIARDIADNLIPRSNSDLVECIALGHDIGHTPFGHAGERALNKCLQQYQASFSHAIQGRIVVTKLEPLGLSDEILDGIENHEFTSQNIPKTREGQIVRFADVVASLNSDYEDIVGIMMERKVDMDELHEALEDIHRVPKRRIDVVIKNIVENSQKKDQVRLGSEMENKIKRVTRAYTRIFVANSFSYKDQEAEHIVTRLFECCLSKAKNRLEYFGEELYKKAEESDPLKVSINHIAGMTDTYAWAKYCQIFAPTSIDYQW